MPSTYLPPTCRPVPWPSFHSASWPLPKVPFLASSIMVRCPSSPAGASLHEIYHQSLSPFPVFSLPPRVTRGASSQASASCPFLALTHPFSTLFKSSSSRLHHVPICSLTLGTGLSAGNFQETSAQPWSRSVGPALHPLGRRPTRAGFIRPANRIRAGGLVSWLVVVRLPGL